MRRVPALVGVALIVALAVAQGVSAASPAARGSGPGLVGRQVGNSPTWHLADGSMVHLHPTRNGINGKAPTQPYQGTPPLFYYGGPIVPSEHVVSIYWAGSTIYAGGPTPGTTGTGAADGSLVGYYLRNLGGSNYYNTNTTYYDTVNGGHTVANNLSYTGFWADNVNAPSGTTSVGDAAIQTEITSGFNAGKITYDPSTIYAVFSSGSVNLGGGFGTQYCAYHGDFIWNGHVVLYAVMPYNYAAGFSCWLGVAPNGDAPADAEVNTLTHELEEANTDPQLNAWFDSSGYEDADECAWIFGNAGLSGGQANITVGTKNFMVQEQWLPLPADGGQCVQGYSPTQATVPGAPTLNSATAGVNSVSLSWSAPGNNGGAAIAGYSIYRSTTSGAEGSTPYATVGNVTSYTDNGAAGGLTYYYTVAATNSVGTGAQSGEKSATPTVAAVPGASTLTASTNSKKGVQLGWTVAASNGSPLTGYRIYRSTSSSSGFALLTTVSGTTVSYHDSSAHSRTRYYYYVVAVNAMGPGPNSNTVNVVAR